MSDWFEQEPSIPSVLMAEVGRLKRRAEARWPLVLAIGLALTALVVWKAASKPTMYRGRTVLAITEGELANGREARPLNEIRDHIAQVLLTREEILKVLERRGMFRSRLRRFGEDFVVASVRDMFDIAVWRNYFQYSYQYDERRTARVAIIVQSSNRDTAYELAHELGQSVINRENELRAQDAQALAEQSQSVLASARARLIAAQSQHSLGLADLAAAQARGNPAEIAIVRMRNEELAVVVSHAEESFTAMEIAATQESLQVAAAAAGMALVIQVVDEHKPPEIERSTLQLVALCLVALCIFLPLAGIVIGTFDTRIHDLEDVTRLDLMPLGHLPGFPGDRVGALRDRGVPRRRMPSWVPWR